MRPPQAFFICKSKNLYQQPRTICGGGVVPYTTIGIQDVTSQRLHPAAYKIEKLPQCWDKQNYAYIFINNHSSTYVLISY